MARRQHEHRTSRHFLRHHGLLLCFSLALFVWLCPVRLDIRLYAVTYDRAPPPDQWLGYRNGRRVPLELTVFFDDEQAAQKAAELLDNLDLLGQTCRVRQMRPSQQDLPFGLPEDSRKVLISGIRRSTAYNQTEKVEDFLRQAGSDDFVWRWRLDGAFAEAVYEDSEKAFEAMESLDGEEYSGRILRATMDCSSPSLRKVLVHGLAYGVLNEDMQDLLNEFGTLKRVHVYGGSEIRVVYKTAEQAYKAKMTLHQSQIFGIYLPIFVCFPYYADPSNTEIRVSRVEGIHLGTLRRHFEKCGEIIEEMLWTCDTPPEFLEQALL